MNEKKLTDEEIVKALEHCYHNRSCEYCYHNDENGSGEIVCRSRLMGKALYLIHRLQAENERLKDEKEEIRLFNLSMQNGKVDMRIESEMVKSFYNSIIQILEQNGAKNFFTATVDIEGKKGRYAFTIEKVGGQTVAEKLAEQKTEIERLTEENGQLKGYNSGLEYEVEQRQKQVDELKKERENVQKILYELGKCGNDEERYALWVKLIKYCGVEVE